MIPDPIPMNFYKPILFYFFLIFSAWATAQEQGSIKASIDKNRILIGEPVTLTVTISLPSGSPVSFVMDSIVSFEILESTIDSSRTETEKILTGKYTITSFDSGHHVIPSMQLTSKIKTDTLPIDVVFSDFDPNQDYHDIKEVIDVPEKRKKEWWYAAAGAIVLLALLIWTLLRKRKTTPKVLAETRVDPFREAMLQLSKLEKENTPAKQFHSELTDIFRLYIFRKKNILSLQKTTDDLVMQLGSLNLDKEFTEKLSQALRLSDFVKFAKYSPSGDDNRNTWLTIKKSIEDIENNVV